MSSLDVPLVYVKGNHDQGPQYTADGRELHNVPCGIDLHGQVLNINGLLLAGLEGAMRYRPNASLMYNEREMRWQFSQLMPRLLMNRSRYGRYLDIFVTHSPAFGIHDKTDLPHTGFKVFLTLMKMFKPRYMLHGHIHLYRADTVKETVFEDEFNVLLGRAKKIPEILQSICAHQITASATCTSPCINWFCFAGDKSRNCS